jgi:hypothetical protein
MTREQILGMLGEGYNLNQIAAIHMISKHRLQEIIDAGACAPIVKKGMSKSIPVETSEEFNKKAETLFPDEPGL